MRTWGPLPTFAATAALGRTSSQPSWSTRTSIPVFSVNFFVFAIHMSSSPCTKRFQRSTRSLAPFSGVHFACAKASVVHSALPAPSDPAAAAPAVVFRKSRLENLLMVAPPLMGTDPGSRLCLVQGLSPVLNFPAAGSKVLTTFPTPHRRDACVLDRG